MFLFFIHFHFEVNENCAQMDTIFYSIQICTNVKSNKHSSDILTLAYQAHCIYFFLPVYTMRSTKYTNTHFIYGRWIAAHGWKFITGRRLRECVFFYFNFFFSLLFSIQYFVIASTPYKQSAADAVAVKHNLSESVYLFRFHI